MVHVIHGLLRRLVLACLFLGILVHVQAAPADIARGVTWLQSQVSPTGQMTVESPSVSLQQARCESAFTLLKLVGQNPQVAGLVTSLHQSGADVPTQSLACEQQLRQQIGQTSLTPEIELRHLAGQGYGAYEGFATASSLDSGWALSAQLANLGPQEKARLLEWLQASQGSDGSFVVNATPDLMATAAILRGLKDEASQSPVAAAIASKAAAYLLGRRNVAGHWSDDATSTALIYEATHPYTALDPTIATGVATYLLGKQLPDGSWADDAFVTAVALRALSLSAQPALDPNLAGLSVKFVDARNNAALPGVLLTASTAPSAISATSDGQGRIELRALNVGAYPLQASLSGYATLNFSVTLQAGQVLDAGVLQMIVSANPTVAVVTGLVRDQTSNLPLEGAAVSVSPQNLVRPGNLWVDFDGSMVQQV